MTGRAAGRAAVFTARRPAVFTARPVVAPARRPVVPPADGGGRCPVGGLRAVDAGPRVGAAFRLPVVPRLDG
ncbi:hypothetical protein GCM10010406_18540 [Streptomyces thermolineatus]|uniref:Uncharacterized protein n=1 Tax=Streptomyces thermolineatus TaxID=44033 RepID=A0ABN3LER1_9ACTN